MLRESCRIEAFARATCGVYPSRAIFSSFESHILPAGDDHGARIEGQVLCL